MRTVPEFSPCREPRMRRPTAHPAGGPVAARGGAVPGPRPGGHMPRDAGGAR
jgi:hypothetical protein